MNEEWKPIKNYEGIYEVSNSGQIRNSRKRIMKTYIINSGYECIKLSLDRKIHSFLIHRLVAEAFIKKLNIYANYINHINENKLDNNITNLEWVTKKENNNKYLDNNLQRREDLKNLKNSLGKKHLPNNYSKYHNVSYDKNRNKWVAGIRVNNKNIAQKRFNTEEEAALHVNYIIDTFNLTDRSRNIIC